MRSWKEDFSPTQLAELASFVSSLKGTTPPDAKEPQGELFTDPNDIAKPDSSANGEQANRK